MAYLSRARKARTGGPFVYSAKVGNRSCDRSLSSPIGLASVCTKDETDRSATIWGSSSRVVMTIIVPVSYV